MLKEKEREREGEREREERNSSENATRANILYGNGPHEKLKKLASFKYKQYTQTEGKGKLGKYHIQQDRQPTGT